MILPQQQVNIVMYHQIRDAALPRPPEGGFDSLLFANQLDYLASNFHILSMEELIEIVDGGRALPSRSACLTFDDGYRTHYEIALPILLSKGLPAAFYASARPVLTQKLETVNQIHLLLSSGAEPANIAREIRRWLTEEWGCCPSDPLLGTLQDDGYDTPEVVYIKRRLQRDIPALGRMELMPHLLNHFCLVDWQEWESSLYISVEQLRNMRQVGMHVGSHGYAHEWLGSLTAEEQREDFRLAEEFLDLVGVPSHQRTICYPYGSYNEETLRLGKDHGYRIGLTTERAVADLSGQKPLEFARVDCIDICQTLGKAKEFDVAREKHHCKEIRE